VDLLKYEEGATSRVQKELDMEIIAKLESTRIRTLPYFELSKEQLDRTYAPGKWPIRVILHHIADTETVLYDRIRRVLSEPGQVQWAFNQDAWVKGLNYSELPLDFAVPKNKCFQQMSEHRLILIKH
jgi:hypothetical protein